MEQIKFTFTLEETNMLLNALGTQPYTHVYQLIQKIHTQASSQLQSPGNGLQSMEPPKK